MHRANWPYWLVLALALTGLSGCGEEVGQPAEETPAEEAKEENSGGFVLGDLVDQEIEKNFKGFTPPSLEELDAQVEWEDGPVKDTLALLHEWQEKQPLLATVPEALKLRNTTPEENRKILSALGRYPQSAEAVDWDAVAIRHAGADVRSTNPIMISSTTEFDVTGMTGAGLFTFDWEMSPMASADTVVRWQTSQDRLYDKVIMRDDVVWSDGKPFTAYDVEFSFKVIMSDKVPVPAVRSGTDQIKYIKAYDARTLVYFHKQALATNVWNVNFPIIPKHIYEKSIHDDPTLQDSDYHVKYEADPVVSGPYKIVSRTRNLEIVLQRREDWYMYKGKQVRDKPYFKEVRFKIIADPNTALLALKKGEIDEMILSPEQWMTQTNGADFYQRCTKAYDTEWVYFYFGWNCDTVFFNDKRVRQAMSYAMDHEELIKKLRYGLDEPSTGIFHNSSPWAGMDVPQPYQQDFDKAEDLLDAAGWIDTDGDGYRDKLVDIVVDGKVVDRKRLRFEFSILCPQNPDRIAVCALLAECLDQIGIMCHVRPMDFAVLMAKTQDHNFQAFAGGWGTGTDPDTQDNLWVTDQGRNYVQYSNPEVDRLFEEGKKEFDLEKRRAIYRQIAAILWEDQPYTWLYFRNAYYGFSKDWRGYVFSPRGPYNYGPGFFSIYEPAKTSR